ncbi:SGS domain-containing protein [Phlyctochytrium arcticum]|nr:SGS domain-containing protein [Phlyctochytrium arcticum]
MTLEGKASLLAAANAAYVDEDFTTALGGYSRVLDASPKDADTLLKRAACHHQLGQYEKASSDAQSAVILAGGDPKLLGKALVKRAQALVALKQWQQALDVLVEAKREAPEESSVIRDKLIQESQKNGAKSNIESCIISPLPEPTPTATPTPTSTTTAPTAIPQPASFLPPSKIRHEWFQNENFVTITVFIKKLQPSDVSITFADQALSLTAKLPTGSDYSLELEPLAHAIDPSESKFSVLGTKIEIKLKKKDLGLRWGTLEGEETGPTSTVTVASTDKPAYPTSARKRHDWDAMAKEVDAEKPEGEQALNALFQQIYRDASEETRRAMMKSYTESNGTCLSTNWAEVGSKPVETTPPEGMIAKKYEK